MAGIGDLFSRMLNKGRGGSADPHSSRPASNRHREANLKVIESCRRERTPYVVFQLCNHAPSYCWDLEETGLAVEDLTAHRTGLPHWKKLPGGGPNSLDGCDCELLPFDPGKTGRPPMAPPLDILTGAKGLEAAQQVFFQKITQNPVAYGKKLARHASRCGFGEVVIKTPAELLESKIPETRLNNTSFGPEGRLEDVTLALLMAQRRLTSRAQLKDLLLATLASKHWSVAGDGQLRFVHPAKTWVVIVDPLTGLVSEFRPF
jgi:hypothetical protein